MQMAPQSTFVWGTATMDPWPLTVSKNDEYGQLLTSRIHKAHHQGLALC